MPCFRSHNGAETAILQESWALWHVIRELIIGLAHPQFHTVGSAETRGVAGPSLESKLN